jgi:hypothetical protein
MATLLAEVKKAMRISTSAYDDTITQLINACIADIGIIGVEFEATTADALLKQAVITYCRLNFGTPSDYDRLKKSYDEQKAQLQSCTGYGLPGDLNG